MAVGIIILPYDVCIVGQRETGSALVYRFLPHALPPRRYAGQPSLFTGVSMVAYFCSGV